VTSPPASPFEPAGLVAERIRRNGPIPFGEFVELALYGPGGFFRSGGGAGRSGRDFLTSPEVGPLFGVCVARALDREWERLGRPDPFVVVEAGAGNGRLAREILRAAPDCARALHLVLVERSAALRAEQAQRLPLEPLSDALGPATSAGPDEWPVRVEGTGPIVSSLEELPAVIFEGVVLANELLDNLAFDVVVRTASGWDEVRVGVTDSGALVEVMVPAAEELTSWLHDVGAPVGTRLPVARAVVDWVVTAARHLRRGSLIVIDYVATWDDLVSRDGGWLRTYAAQRRGGPPLRSPGRQDITIDVPVAMVEHAAAGAGLTITFESQAAWLRGLGIDGLVAAGRATWAAKAASPDLGALVGRSRGPEAAALTDPAGLGGHSVLTLVRD
jgi:NADH dehydrogenase [ubiquinone] 1 alpha subcomplex assembly factor 7